MIRLVCLPEEINVKAVFKKKHVQTSRTYPNYPIVKSFTNMRFFFGFYTLGLYNFFGCLKHWSLGIICTYIFPKYSKKNIQTLFRLCGLYGTAITEKINKLNNTDPMFINNTVFPEFVVNTHCLKQKNWLRLNKKKRSLPRRSRKKFFTSLMGRIWLT